MLRQNEEFAFELLYKRYWKKLYAVAYNRVNSEEIAQDLVQEIFINLWIKRESLEIRSFPSYIFSALKYAVIDYIRSRSVKDKYIKGIIKANTFFDHSTENNVTYNELNEQIEREINKLPEKCRIVYNLRRKENYSLKQIADQLNISQKTAENHITKALKLLRLSLTDFIAVLIAIIFW